MNAKQRRHHYGRITLDLLAHRRRVAHISLWEQLAYDIRRAQKKRNRRIQRWRRSGSVSLWWAAAFEGAAAGFGAALVEWTRQISVAGEEAMRALLRLGVVVDETGWTRRGGRDGVDETGRTRRGGSTWPGA